ncbi:hypothetical protein [Alteromonas sp. AMM-1]
MRTRLKHSSTALPESQQHVVPESQSDVTIAVIPESRSDVRDLA